MSSEVSQQNSNMSQLALTMAFPTIITTGSAISAVKTHGVKGLKTAQNAKGFAKLNETMQKQGVDVFTRASALSNGYEQYASVIKQEAKTAKKLQKANALTDLTPWQKFKNLFKKQGKKTTLASYKQGVEEASKAANKAADAARDAVSAAGDTFSSTTAKNLDNVLNLTERTTFSHADDVIKGVAKTGQSAFKTGIKGLGSTVKNNFIAELSLKKSGAFNYIMTAITFIPNVFNDVIPTFKEEGFVEGMKATGKTLLRAAADLVGFAAGGSIGRVIGSVAGILIPFIPKGVGAKVGGMLGDIICSMLVGGFVTKKVDKMVGADENGNLRKQVEPQEQLASQEAQIQTQQIAQQNPQIEVQQEATSAQEVKTTQTQVESQNETSKEDIAKKYADMPSKHEIEQLAYKQAFKGKGGNFNRYYA